MRVLLCYFVDSNLVKISIIISYKSSSEVRNGKLFIVFLSIQLLIVIILKLTNFIF